MIKFFNDGKQGPVEVPEAKIASAYLDLPISTLNQKRRDAVLFLAGYIECLKVVQAVSKSIAFRRDSDHRGRLQQYCETAIKLKLEDLAEVVEKKRDRK